MKYIHVSALCLCLASGVALASDSNSSSRRKPTTTSQQTSTSTKTTVDSQAAQVKTSENSSDQGNLEVQPQEVQQPAEQSQENDTTIVVSSRSDENDNKVEGNNQEPEPNVNEQEDQEAVSDDVISTVSNDSDENFGQPYQENNQASSAGEGNNQQDEKGLTPSPNNNDGEQESSYFDAITEFVSENSPDPYNAVFAVLGATSVGYLAYYVYEYQIAQMDREPTQYERAALYASSVGLVVSAYYFTTVYYDVAPMQNAYQWSAESIAALIGSADSEQAARTATETPAQTQNQE